MIPSRAGLIGILHAAAKRMGLSDDDYRDRLERISGCRSARDLDDDQLLAAVDDFKRDNRPKLHPHAAKCRAIWIGLFNLGAVEGSDSALDAFAQRQTGSAKLAFVSAADARRVTEALKAMAAREGWDIPSDDAGGMGARRNLVLAQWKKLREIHAIGIADPAALVSWARNQRVIGCTAWPHQWKRQELDTAAKKLGQWIRKHQTKTATHPPLEGGSTISRSEISGRGHCGERVTNQDTPTAASPPLGRCAPSTLPQGEGEI